MSATSASPADGLRSVTWPDDTAVYPAATARFGDQVWDLTALRPANHVPSHYQLSFVGLSEEWSRLAREMCMCRIDVRTARRAGFILRRSVKALTTVNRFYLGRRMARFAADTGRGVPSTWHRDDIDAVVRWQAGRSRNHRELERTVDFVRDFHRFAPLLSGGGLCFEPWPQLSVTQVLKQVLGGDAPAVPDRATVTPLMPLEAFVPLFLAARSYLEVFAADILALQRLFATERSDTHREASIELIKAWAADPANLVPLHTAGSAAKSRSPAAPGDPMWAVIARHVGGTWQTVRSHECRDIIRGVVAAGRVHDGIGVRTALVERPDGTLDFWRGPFESFPEVRQELGALRSAAYIVLVGLTGMRDSEAQDIQRDAVHEHYGTPALRTRRHKMRLPESEPISWWVCDLALVAYRTLDTISDHPTHVMASVTRPGTSGFNARRAMHDFVGHVNANVATTGLAPIPDMEQLSPQVLRETAAYAMGRFTELGDIVVGHLFGHARAATTASYQRHRPGDTWNIRVHEGRTDATVVLLDTLAKLIDDDEPIIGPRNDELRQTASAVRATIIADPSHAKRIASLHQANWHHGEVVSCRFEPGPAVCHRLARQMGITDPGPGPLHDLCVGPGCGNAHYTTLHLPRLRRDRSQTAQRLTDAPVGSAAARQLAADLDEADLLIAKLEGPP